MKYILLFVSVLFLMPLAATAQNAKSGVIVVRKPKVNKNLPHETVNTKEFDKNPKSDYRPRFPGGLDSMEKFFQEFMIYPPEAIKNAITGRVGLALVIDRYGNVESVKVSGSLGYGCDEEAVRLAKLMKWMPAMYSTVATRKGIYISVPFNYKELMDKE
jgi:TonB family protein